LEPISTHSPDTATGQLWLVDPVHSRIRFDVKYLLGTVSGWFSQFEGSILTHGEVFDGAAAEVTIYSSSITTANEERDSHLRSAVFFDTDHFPVLRFQTTSLRLHEKEGTVSGMLTIRNMSQQVVIRTSYLGTITDPMGNPKACFELSTLINRKDFDMTWNQHIDQGGLLLSDEVAIHCNIQLLRVR